MTKKTIKAKAHHGTKQKPGGKGRYAGSKPVVTKTGDCRELTLGESLMARKIFKDSIFYREVMIYKGNAFPFQDEMTIVTPRNEMYCPTGVFQEDFSKAIDPKDKEWFMHEMTHIWQYNRGYRGRLIAKGALYGAISASSKTGTKWVYEYYYTKNIGKKFSEFNMEQQADIIAHYYGAKFLNDIIYIHRLPFLESVLADFLKEPSAVALLPGGGPQPYEIPIAP
ncbi:MAG: hypothetical protein VB050_18030 [Geobacteraceae bacterium]|nr:hypothetical protein [Geobacteraceae bacterium]